MEVAGAGRPIWEVVARHAINPYRTWLQTYDGYEDALQEARLLAWQLWKTRPNANDPVAYLVTATRHRLARGAASLQRYWSNRLALDAVSDDPALLVGSLDQPWAQLVPEERALLEYRADGATWKECGYCLGISRQAARQRFERIRKRVSNHDI